MCCIIHVGNLFLSSAELIARSILAVYYYYSLVAGNLFLSSAAITLTITITITITVIGNIDNTHYYSIYVYYY